jgi:hypothetical protein
MGMKTGGWRARIIVIVIIITIVVVVIIIIIIIILAIFLFEKHIRLKKTLFLLREREVCIRTHAWILS